MKNLPTGWFCSAVRLTINSRKGFNVIIIIIIVVIIIIITTTTTITIVIIIIIIIIIISTIVIFGKIDCRLSEDTSRMEHFCEMLHERNKAAPRYINYSNNYLQTFVASYTIVTPYKVLTKIHCLIINEINQSRTGLPF